MSVTCVVVRSLVCLCPAPGLHILTASRRLISFTACTYAHSISRRDHETADAVNCPQLLFKIAALRFMNGGVNRQRQAT